MHTGRPAHLSSFDYLGRYRYSLTFCTHNRERLFTTADRVDLVYGQLLHAARDETGVIVVACFMPDHLHLLIEMESDASNCLEFISRAKQFSGFYFKQRFGRQFWQRYGYERVLRNDEQTLAVARYIVENPVRAQLAVCAEEYPFTRSERYTVRQIVDSVQIGETANTHRSG
jgi:REP element-mobilizing transposase RayT